MKLDVSFIYITHNIDSRDVTYHKRKNESHSEEISVDSKFVRVYHDDVDSWRKLLKVGDSQHVLVAFAWCNDEKLYNARIFPECLACNPAFNVTKEQRNLFLYLELTVTTRSLLRSDVSCLRKRHVYTTGV